MSYLTKLKNGKYQIDKTAAFCELTNHKIPNIEKSFQEILSEFDKAVLQKNKTISQGALNNSHGDWYEWLLAIAAWNFRIKHKKTKIALLLPNIKQFDVAELYNEELYNLIVDLREKVISSTSVQLITSNPDFVIIDTANIECPEFFNKKIKLIDADTISQINSAYSKFKHQCDFDDIVGYISVKTSFRPDRRLQIPHEGSLMKAIYTHLQTRKWILNPPGLKYFAFSTSVGEADIKALKTVATHSITTVHTEPQAAVDEVYSVNSIQEASDAYQVILN